MDQQRPLTKVKQIQTNAQLFSIIYNENEPLDEKLCKIRSVLNKGADVNARDANDDNNTPLHKAVIFGEPEVVTLLLEKGANADIKNNANKKCVDIANYSDYPNRTIITDILKDHFRTLAKLNKNFVQSPVPNIIPAVQPPIQKHSVNKSQLKYLKTSGSSGIKGQFYETKLVMLVLTRLLNIQKPKEMYLATNVAGLGAFDDLVIRYKTCDQDKTEIIFVQAKHKDNLKVSLTDLALRSSKDFDIKNKYYKSYLEIRAKFNQNSNDDILYKDRYEDVDCKFIIYTSRQSSGLLNKKENIGANDLLYTISDGKIFVDDSSNPTIPLDVDNNETYFEKDFYNRFKIYTNQGKENEVEEIVQKYIDYYYNTVKDSNSNEKTKAIFDIVHSKVVNWWKESDGSYLTQDCDFFDVASSIVKDSLLKGISYNYITQLRNYKIEFDIAEIESFVRALTKTEDQIILIKTNETTLCSIKLLQYLKEKNSKSNYLFIDLSAPGASLEIFSTELKEILVDTLVIVCHGYENKKQLFQKLKKITDEFKREIILIINSTLSDEFNGIDIKTKLTDTRNGFVDLSPTSREILYERTILFQGLELSLGTLIGKTCEHLIQSKVLLAIINNETIKIGKSLQGDACDEKRTSECYISRNIHRCIKLNKSKKIEKDFFIIDLIEYEHLGLQPNNNQDIIIKYQLHTANATSFIIPNEYRNRNNIHWFREEQGELVWKKSKGNLERLFQYINRDTNSYKNNCSKKEPKTIEDIEDNVVIIAAEPGMGKSSLLSHLTENTKQKYPSMWIIRINLREHTEVFNMWRNKELTNIDKAEVLKFLYNVTRLETNSTSSNEKTAMYQNNEHLIDFISDKNSSHISFKGNGELLKLTKSALLEIELFVHFYNEGTITLLLDGFDEIYPDYKEQVIMLLETVKQLKIKRLWVTTRSYNIQTILENKFCTFSYALEPLSHYNQLKLLTTLWKKELDSKASNGWLNGFVDAFLNEMAEHINDENKYFTGVPLHINMIAKIFCEQVVDGFEKSTSDSNHQLLSAISADMIKILNLVTLYERFVHTKFYEIRFRDKLPTDFSSYTGILPMIDDNYLRFLENHKRMAAVSMFGLNRLKKICSKHELEELHKLVRSFKKEEDKIGVGIIERIINNVPKYFHFTYAEYFAAEYLIDKLKAFPSRKKISTWEFLVRTVLISGEPGVRRFIDSKLITDEKLSDLSYHTVAKKTIFELLNEKREYASKNYYPMIDLYRPILLPTSTALYVAVEEGLIHIANFLLRCIEGNLNKDNLNEFIKTIRERCRYSCVLCAAVIRKNKEVISNLIDHIKSIDVAKLTDIIICEDVPSTSSLIIAGFKHEDKQIVDILLKDLNSVAIGRVMNIKYSVQCTLLHVLARIKNITLILPYLEKNSRTQIRKMFMAKTWTGRLPAHDAACSKYYDFFSISESLLTKHEFKKMCTAGDNYGSTPIDFLFTLSPVEGTDETFVNELKLKLKK